MAARDGAVAQASNRKRARARARERQREEGNEIEDTESEFDCKFFGFFQFDASP